MVITVKDITLKFDLDNAADQTFNIDITGNDFSDIQKQVKNFARNVQNSIGARKSEAKLGKNSFTDIGSMFRGQNPNAKENE